MAPAWNSPCEVDEKLPFAPSAPDVLVDSPLAPEPVAEASARAVSLPAPDCRRADAGVRWAPPMDPVTLDQLRVFLSIVDVGSFSGAARRLQRAQSAVSYAISHLERSLAVQLFDRSTRTPTLTEQGRALLADARLVTDRVDRLEERARELSGRAEPRVSLAVDGLDPLGRVLCALAGLRQAFPEVQVTLFTEMLGGVVAHVKDGACQIGVSAPVVEQEPDLTWQPLDRVELVSVAAAGHPLAAWVGPIPSAELQAHTQLVITDRSHLTAGRDFGVHSGMRWQLADLEAKHACLRAGFGWGGMPLHRVREDLERGTLKKLEFEGVESVTSFEALLVHRSGFRPGPAATWLIERLKADGCH